MASLGEMIALFNAKETTRPFWIPYCGRGPGWCWKLDTCPSESWRNQGCVYLAHRHPWSGLSPKAFQEIVSYAYKHPLRVRRRATR